MSQGCLVHILGSNAIYTQDMYQIMKKRALGPHRSAVLQCRSRRSECRTGSIRRAATPSHQRRRASVRIPRPSPHASPPRAAQAEPRCPAPDCEKIWHARIRCSMTVSSTSDSQHADARSIHGRGSRPYDQEERCRAFPGGERHEDGSGSPHDAAFVAGQARASYCDRGCPPSFVTWLPD